LPRPSWRRARGKAAFGAPLHRALLALSGVSTKLAAISAAPVVEEKETVPVAVDKTVRKKSNILGWASTAFGGGGFGLAAFSGFDWRALVVILGFAVVVTIDIHGERGGYRRGMGQS
jgi:putative chitinase